MKKNIYKLLFMLCVVMCVNTTLVMATNGVFNGEDLTTTGTPLKDYWGDNLDATQYDAYNETHEANGAMTEDHRETEGWDILHNPENSNYNGAATSTGGKVPGTIVSFCEGVDSSTGKVSWSTDATITIPAGQSVLVGDGHGTETSVSEGRDYTTQVTGLLYGDNGVVWVQFSVTDGENGGERNAYLPLSELTPEERAALEPLPTLPKKPTRPTSSHGYIYMSQSTHAIFSNYNEPWGTPETEIKLYDDVYDITQGVPTSEYINVYGKAPKALYFIKVRATTITAGCYGVTIQAHADYESWDETYHAGRGGKHDKCTSRCEWDWVTHSVTQTCIENYSDSISKTFYDVPESSIYKLVSVTVTETNETYSRYKLVKTVNMDGIDGPGPDTLNFNLSNPNINSSYNLDYEGFHGRNGWGAAAADARNSSGSAGKGAITAELNAAINRSVQGDVNYNWCGLSVTRHSCNGEPNPGYSEAYDEILIPQSYPNGTYSPEYNTSASNYPDCYFSYKGFPQYKNAGEENGKWPDLPNPEHVVVHTPVVNRASITSVGPFVNQKVNIDQAKVNANYYLMLDEEFTITIPDSGTHRNIQGYGTRTYNSKQGDSRCGNKNTTWATIKDVKFPFDVYVNGKSGAKYFLKAGTWMSASTWWASALEDITTRYPSNPSIGIRYTFTVPVWVNEQIYSGGEGKSIEVRIIAENAYGDRNIDATNHLDETGNYQIAEANTDITKYVAVKYIDCEVIGKIYDLRINASNDPGWTQVYSHKTRNEYIMANEFPFGQQGHNRVTQYKYAPKLGYTFVFNFKTKGRKSNNIDVSIQPEGFYFISKTGGAAQPVDLYYDSTTQRNIPIVPGDTTGSVTVRLTDAFMEVPSQEFVDSNRIYQQEYGRVYNYSVGVKIGNFAKTNLPHSLRLCYNNFAEYVNKLYGTGSTESSISNNAGTRDNVIGSVGHWWAGYRLPASTIAVPKGTTPTADKSNALKNGYILVKFNIVTKSPTDSSTDPVAGEPGNNYLRYLGPEALNEAGEETGTPDPTYKWPNPGNNNNPEPTHPGKTPPGTPTDYPNGSVAIFDADMRSSNDLEVGGTH